ncbi:hypothetical protein [Sulfobacillus harzensis]|uniref:Methyltransferase domain-containing protein n=1 Tax=Sulfobacillus harzensis TaxID=2729629 RepID=A0A7Y0L6H2_9FIRM|nr:hypothetical protein [Sulfobacillus harzensis]NMP22824.1 hypothetical protein [Sulfobacillus harzensis]
MESNAWDNIDAVREYVLRQRANADYLERPAIESVLPPLRAKRVLDLGAGAGDWAAWAANAGASSVTAVEKSLAMRSFFIFPKTVRWLVAALRRWT